ncbi:MAG: hypothetical protein KF797_00280 [Flavobacteriales bacterium]|nr:hypothetical protein [Flavobacteriales bacterium]
MRGGKREIQAGSPEVPLPAGAAPWRIVDMQGRTMIEGRFTAVGSHVVDTDALIPGAYLLVQQGDEVRRVARFVEE